MGNFLNKVKEKKLKAIKSEISEISKLVSSNLENKLDDNTVDNIKKIESDTITLTKIVDNVSNNTEKEQFSEIVEEIKNAVSSCGNQWDKCSRGLFECINTDRPCPYSKECHEQFCSSKCEIPILKGISFLDESCCDLPISNEEQTHVGIPFGIPARNVCHRVINQA